MSLSLFNSKLRSLTWSLSRLKDPSAKPLTTGNLISTPLISPIPLLRKIIKIEILEEEGLLKMALVTSRLRHQSLMATSNRKTTWIGYEPLRGTLN